VLPLDRRSSAEILAGIRDLPAERLRLGVGSGQSRRPLPLLERGIAELRAGTDVPILVGALGPRARRLAAEVADGILFSWLTPDHAAAARVELHRDAEGRAVQSVLYARAIAARAAADELAAEVSRYASYRSYAANFARLGIDPADTTIDLTVEGSAAGFEAATDELVLRLVTATGAVDELEHAIRAGAAG
jgi:alkanesulfonate monooxygenase SsuD/methylene tetrahydromethanopterin reductase-like flavin-dependent oxidoreductase (luciferase family)